MKYHYQIVSSFDPTDIPVDSAKERAYPFYYEPDAKIAGSIKMGAFNLNPEQYYVRVVPIAETVTEEDELDGHAYPGHEMWDDFPKTIEEYNRMCEDNERSFK